MDLRNQVVFAIGASILIHQLFIPPVIGLADNGDFYKLILAFDLYDPGHDDVKFAPTVYRFDRSRHHSSGFYSSEALLLMTAFGLHRLFTDSADFDIRLLGVVHSILFLGALVLLLPLTRRLGSLRRIAVLALMVIVFCDVMYVSYLNSFYMDTAALLFLMLAVAFAVRSALEPTRRDAILLVVCCALMAGSKAQHCLAGFAAAAFLFWKGHLFWPGKRRAFGVAAGGAIAAVSIAGLLLSPYGYSAIGPYTVIFYEILPNSPDPDHDLVQLGLDSSFRAYIGTHYYSPEAPLNNNEAVEAFSRRTSYARIGWFYLTHPQRMVHPLRVGLGQAAIGRAPMLGNFDRSAGRPPYAQSQSYAWWSSLKRRVFEFRPWLYLALVTASALLVCIFAGRAIPAAWALAAMMFAELFTASLADAAEMTRHLFLFNAMADMLLIAAVAAAFRARTLN